MKNILFSLLLVSTVSSQAMLVKRTITNPFVYKQMKKHTSHDQGTTLTKKSNSKTEQLQQQQLCDSIRTCITHNLQNKRDAQLWKIEVHNLVKAFPKKEREIYSHLQEIITQHQIAHPIKEEIKNIMPNVSKSYLLKCALVPGSVILSLSSGIGSFILPFAYLVGEISLEKLCYSMPCALTATGVFTTLMISLMNSTDPGQLKFGKCSPKDQIKQKMIRYKNISSLQKIVKEYQKLHSYEEKISNTNYYNE